MRGDTIEMTVDNGTGVPATYRVRASRVGRRVELDTGRSMVTIREVRRDGTAVDTMRFPIDRIIAIREYRETEETKKSAPRAAEVPPAEAADEDTMPGAGASDTGSSVAGADGGTGLAPVASGSDAERAAVGPVLPLPVNRKGKSRKPGKRRR